MYVQRNNKREEVYFMYVKIENISFAYADEAALRNVSFGIDKGKITGLIGSNGAGKSTMLKIMIKKLKPQSGKITIDGMDIVSLKNDNFPVTFVPDVPVYYEELTVWEHMQFIKALYPQSNISIKEIIMQFNLQEHLHKIPAALSKGTLQKMMIALALLRQYEIFLADEPFTGLDPKQIYGFKQILQELKQQDKAILISTHLLDMAEGICDKYVFLHNGKILAEGGKTEIIKQYHLKTELTLEELYMFLLEGDKHHACL